MKKIKVKPLATTLLGYSLDANSGEEIEVDKVVVEAYEEAKEIYLAAYKELKDAVKEEKAKTLKKKGITPTGTLNAGDVVGTITAHTLDISPWKSQPTWGTYISGHSAYDYSSSDYTVTYNPDPYNAIASNYEYKTTSWSSPSKALAYSNPGSDKASLQDYCDWISLAEELKNTQFQKDIYVKGYYNIPGVGTNQLMKHPYGLWEVTSGSKKAKKFVDFLNYYLSLKAPNFPLHYKMVMDPSFGKILCNALTHQVFNGAAFGHTLKVNNTVVSYKLTPIGSYIAVKIHTGAVYDNAASEAVEFWLNKLLKFPPLANVIKNYGGGKW